jgi:hypothetical protein
VRSSPANSARIEYSYRLALYLYPVCFRERNQAAMMQSLRDALADGDLPRPALLQTLLKDIIESLLKENFVMLRETISRPILLYNALVLLALFTVLSLGFVVIEQQAMRQSANDPQLGMAADLADRLAHGAAPASAISSDQIDMDASPSAFVIAYNEQGLVLASSAQLNGTVPALPRGVLEFARTHGEERVTWAPRRDVRIASIVRHVAGPQGGFVLAGRNLREIEARKDLIFQMAALVWLGLIGIIFVGTFLFGWLTRTPRPVAA